MAYTQNGQAATDPTQYAMSVPLKIVATGVYGMKPQVTKIPMEIPGSYILAQLSNSYRRAINSGFYDLAVESAVYRTVRAVL